LREAAQTLEAKDWVAAKVLITVQVQMVIVIQMH